MFAGILLFLVLSAQNLVFAQHVGNIKSTLGGGEPRKEITATVSRSLVNETVTLKALLPENVTEAKVSVYNMLGNLIEERSVTANEKNELLAVFSTKGLPVGPYIVILVADGQKVVNKVMVTRY